MKKPKAILRWSLICILGTVIIFTPSCATVFGGKVSQCQRTKPQAGEPARKLRVGAFVADVLLFWPGLAIDFATNAIYKPCSK